MNACVSYQTEGEVGVVCIDAPPVNALGHAVRAGLMECLQRGLDDILVHSLVVLAAGRTFPAGADIREFGKTPVPPLLTQVVNALEASAKPVVAAIHGTALGGGLELALGCDYRIALAGARLGFPEVKLGLLPGATGTQRLPRLIGAEAALKMTVSGNPVDARKAHALGLVDAVCDGDLRRAAIDYARAIVAKGQGKRRLSECKVDAVPAVFDDFERSIARKSRGFLAPFRCIDAVRAAVKLPFDEGCRRERELFETLMVSPQSAAQRHVFFAEREVGRILDLDPHTTTREIGKVGVIGAGTMGGGIAMNFLNAGIPVTLLEVKREALDRGVAAIRENYTATARKGRLTADEVERRMALLHPTLGYADLGDADLVVEAVFENLAVKQAVFRRLDGICRPGAILVSNTSTLDINAIAAVTQRPADVMGMHFFSPANVMRLVENVRGDDTADDVLATIMQLSRRIGKIAVLVRVCEGFVGNRILHRRRAAAMALVAEGATPAQVDRVLYDFGFPMGPFAMSDLVGLDVSYRIRQGQREADPDHGPKRTWLDELVESGRLGQKTGGGVYDYAAGSRKPVGSAMTADLIEKYRSSHRVVQRRVSDEEVLEQCLYAMVNEAAKILEEGIAQRPHDVDITWIHGYGFPAYRGGLLYWADHVGLKAICDRMADFYQSGREPYWEPAPLLVRLAQTGRSFYGNS